MPVAMNPQPEPCGQKHTPGPWFWDTNALLPKHDEEKRLDVYILKADGAEGALDKAVAIVVAERQADRRLIAAAPTLLTALQELLACQPYSDWMNARWKQAADAGEAAVATAIRGTR